MARCRAVLLQCIRGIAVRVADRTYKFDRGVLQPVVIDKEALVKISVRAHERRVMLVNETNILLKVLLIKDAMQALDRSVETMRITLDAILITDTIVSQR